LKPRIAETKQLDAAKALKDYLSYKSEALAQDPSARQADFDVFNSTNEPAIYDDGNLSPKQSFALTMPYFCLQAAKALRVLVKKVMPIIVSCGFGGYNIGYPALFNSYFSDIKITKIVVQAAKTAMDRVERLERGDAVAASDLLTDLRAAARSVLGENNETLVWKILGVYGLRGPDMLAFRDLNLDENQTALWAASLALFGSLTYLDSLQFNALGKQYSLPPHVASPAPWPKPYHFWLPAFLVREMVEEEGFSARAASIAVHLSHLGYEFLSRSLGRNPLNAFNGGAFSNYNNIVRSDLLLAAAGNQFGVLMAKGSEATPIRALDLDQMWNRYYARLRAVPSWITERTKDKVSDWLGGNVYQKAATYLGWRYLIKPDIPRKLVARAARS
jgi:hypothetical protein